MKQEDIKKLHNGLHKCPGSLAKQYMPELSNIFDSFPKDLSDYIVDVKVHMLMPKQFPCIPDWHRDLVPRDENKNLLLDQIDTNKKMFLWISNGPLPEFEDKRIIEPETWIEFTQADVHRGTASDKHQWRIFIRVIPKELTKPNPPEKILRRHTQVYLDAENFKW